jgi:hypothetical protein
VNQVIWYLFFCLRYRRKLSPATRTMGFFDDVWDTVRSGASSIGGGISDVWHEFKGSVAEVGSGIQNTIMPVVNAGAGIINNVVDRAGDLAGKGIDKGLDLVGKPLDILSSPFVWIAVGLVAVMVLPQVLNSRR